MTIDFVASERQYADHLLPLWFGLAEGHRGRWYLAGGRDIERHLSIAGIPGNLVDVDKPRPAHRLTVVASFNDLAQCRRRPIAFVNHGIGQTYDGDVRSRRHPSYSGGGRRDSVVLYLCPSERDAERCRSAQPHVPAVAVGSPRLDPWHTLARGRVAPSAQIRQRSGGEPQETVTPGHGPGAPVIAVSWHFPLKLIPETMWAWPEYAESVAKLAETHTVIGHGHPRAWGKLEPWYESVGIEPVADFADVLRRADLYVCDNSSTLYEFASTGRPVVVLNSVLYRREVEHGLRFWSHADVGVQVDSPNDLPVAIETALADPPDVAQRRTEIVADLLGDCDGNATLRACDALREAAAKVEAEPDPGRGSSPFGARRPARTPNDRRAPVAEFPVRRLSRLGATADQIIEGRARWATMSDEEQVASLAEMDAQTDATLRERLAEDRADRVTVAEHSGAVPDGWKYIDGEWVEG